MDQSDPKPDLFYKFKKLPYDMPYTIVMGTNMLPFVKVERSPIVTEWHYLNPTGEFNLLVMDKDYFKVEIKGEGSSFDINLGEL